MKPTPRAAPRATMLAAMLLLGLTSWVAWTAPPTPYREVEVDLSATSLGHEARRPGRRGAGLRFSVAAMQSPRSTYADYSRLFARVGHLAGAETELVQRRTYGEVNDLLAAGELDAALLCTGGYLELQRRAPTSIEVVAVPVVGGKTTYQSFVIVPASGPAHRIEDLAGRRFAFTDELSLSGRAYVVHWLRQAGHDPARFFGDTLITRSHDRSIDAVARGLVDGAAVDSLVFEYWRRQEPQRSRSVRVIHESPAFGMMPIVVSTRLPAETRARLRDVLLSLERDPEAAAAMRAIHFERFVAPAAGLFDSAAAVLEPPP